MWSDVLLTAIWGGVVALDRRAFLQAMLSRPLVASVGTGLLLHDVQAGLFIGLIFELFHLGAASLGGVHPDHETLPAVTAAAWAAGVGHTTGSAATPAMWTIAILAFAPMGRVGRWLEVALDERAKRYAGRAREAAEAGALASAARQNLRALWPQFVFYGLACGVAEVAGHALGALHTLPSNLTHGLTLAFPVIGVVASGVAVAGSSASRRTVLGAVFATAAMLVALLLRGGA